MKNNINNNKDSISKNEEPGVRNKNIGIYDDEYDDEYDDYYEEEKFVRNSRHRKNLSRIPRRKDRSDW